MKSAVAGEFVLVFGTSCSAPVVGSMITLINDARLAAGKGPVGKWRHFLWAAQIAQCYFT